jgi:nucleotide-binding universal stress UspA family protein
VTGRILVGVDGGPGSLAALRWALAQAVGRDRVVDVITCWEPQFAVPAVVTALGPPLELPAPDDVERAMAAEAKATAEHAVRRCRAAWRESRRSSADRAQTRTWALRGPAGEVLTEIAGPTDLIVLGPSGHGVIVGAMLGSVTHYVLQHSRSPVVVVPTDGG